MDTNVDKKLTALQKLQDIDCELDEIKKVRGDLPEEVQDLEDEIAGLETRKEKFKSDIITLENKISDYKSSMKESESLIKKYEEQQMNVRNNREYDAITKEVELQQLEIQVSEKRIKEARISIEQKQKDIEEVSHTLEERSKDLTNKQEELTVITKESEDDESKLSTDREKAVNKIEDRLYKSYERIRGNAKNGLAVVSIRRNACGGCFNTVPPQRQSDVKERKKIIVCEHCGRILADAEFVIEEEKPKRKTTRTATKKVAS